MSKKISSATTDAVIQYLTMYDFLAWPNPTIGVYDEEIDKRTNGKFKFRYPHRRVKGPPDVLALFRGQFIGIEVKVNDRLSLDQVKFMVKILVNDGHYFIVRNLDDLTDSLSFYGYEVVTEWATQKEWMRMSATAYANKTIEEDLFIPNANLIPKLKMGDIEIFKAQHLRKLAKVLGKYFCRLYGYNKNSELPRNILYDLFQE